MALLVVDSSLGVRSGTASAAAASSSASFARLALVALRRANIVEQKVKCIIEFSLVLRDGCLEAASWADARERFAVDGSFSSFVACAGGWFAHGIYLSVV